MFMEQMSIMDSVREGKFLIDIMCSVEFKVLVWHLQ